MPPSDLLNEYLAGPDQLRAAIAGMNNAQLFASPIAGQWSTRQVVAHLADFEIVFAERAKRIIAEEGPTIFDGDENLFAARLHYDRRSIADDLNMIAAVRRHTASILGALPQGDFERIGRHNLSGPVTLGTFFARIVAHIPHHIRFIEAKRAALGILPQAAPR